MSNVIQSNKFIKKKLVDNWFNFYNTKTIEELLQLSVDYHYSDTRNLESERIQGLVKVLKNRNMLYMVEYFTEELEGL